ncbi:hypothetical protein [Saccharopolyspora sp. NPDC002376]
MSEDRTVNKDHVSRRGKLAITPAFPGTGEDRNNQVPDRMRTEHGLVRRPFGAGEDRNIDLRG